MCRQQFVLVTREFRRESCPHQAHEIPLTTLETLTHVSVLRLTRSLEHPQRFDPNHGRF